MFLFSYDRQAILESETKKTTLEQVVLSKAFTVTSTLVLIFLYILFLYRHIGAYIEGASVVLLIYVCMESTVILLYMFRSAPILRTAEIMPWLFAVTGTFLPVLLLPTGIEVSKEISIFVTVFGSILALFAYASLNRSMGISPALRKIKTKGLYRFVRHPMYFSYFIILIGYLLAVLSVWNVAVVAVIFYIQISRTFYEETLLEHSKEYAEYKKKVHWRFLPGIV